jgi:hypothetical protein
VRYRLIPARAADIATPRQGRSVAELHDGLRSSLEELEALFAANPNLEYDKMIHQHRCWAPKTFLICCTSWLTKSATKLKFPTFCTDSRFPMAGLRYCGS